MYPLCPSTDDQIVAHSLDPRSRFPRCDFCASKQGPGEISFGRWWAHTTCATKPDNLLLASAQLPPLNYTTIHRTTPSQKVGAMLLRIDRWAGQARMELRRIAIGRGECLLDETIDEFTLVGRPHGQALDHLDAY